LQNGAGIVQERKHLLKVSMHPPMIPSCGAASHASLVPASIGPLRGEGPAKSRACRCSCRRPLECRP
jgi:hypothetical protein